MNILMWIGVILLGLCLAVLGCMVWAAPRIEAQMWNEGRPRAGWGEDDETAEQVGPPRIPWRGRYHGRSPAQEARLRAPRRLR